MTSYNVTIDEPVSFSIMNSIVLGTCFGIFGIVMVADENDRPSPTTAKKIIFGGIALAVLVNFFSPHTNKITFSPITN